jgi:16S rRNA (uracil1498-N3)-methyltransferase
VALTLAIGSVIAPVMRANYKLQRLFVTAPLAEGHAFEATLEQAHYLQNVLRMGDGGELLVFNGGDGEWRATLQPLGKKRTLLTPVSLERPQPAPSELFFCFAPLKAGRLDYLVEKAVEMGAGVLQPVTTQFTQQRHLNMDKVRAWTIEAAEQCGVLAIPEIREPVGLDVLLAGWDASRRLIFCDEDAATNNPLPALQAIKESKLGLLVGPEGGFSDAERARLRALPYVTAIPLGPRILRADTAAIAALAVVQAVKGDW